MTWAEANRAWREQARLLWQPEELEPVLIRAWLGSEVAYDGYDPVTLEGALQSVVCMRATGCLPDDVYADCPLTAPLEDTDIQIPIADTAMGGPPIANVSVGWFSPDAVATKRQSWKRARADHYARDVVKTSAAATKTQMVLKATVTALHVDFYARGDRVKLESLLRDVGHVGAGRAGGLGSVVGWEVLPAPGEWWFVGPGHRLMRTLPATAEPGWSEYDVRPATLRAPYWHQRTRAICHVPIQRLGEPLAAGARGQFFITPHAVERYRERIPGKARLSYEQARDELALAVSRAHFVRQRDDGGELWRARKPTRLRFIVARVVTGLPQVRTVLAPFDGLEVRA